MCIVTELGDTSLLTLWEVLFPGSCCVSVPVCTCVCFPLPCSSNNQSPAADLNFNIMVVTITRLHMVVKSLQFLPGLFETVGGRSPDKTAKQKPNIFALTLSKIRQKNLHRPLLLGCSIAKCCLGITERAPQRNVSQRGLMRFIMWKLQNWHTCLEVMSVWDPLWCPDIWDTGWLLH